jgi:hypothetical protein
MNTSLNDKALRQGDVLLQLAEGVDDADLGERQKTPKDAPLILAYGEVTGHSHAIRMRGAALYQPKGKPERFLKVVRTVSLTHEEHAPVKIDPGVYRVLIQQEYSPAEMRSVED